MNKRNLITIISSIIAVIAIIVLVIFITKPYQSKYDGTIKIELISIDDKVIKEEDIKFKKDDTLLELVEAYFENVLFKDGMLLNIEDYVTPTNYETYLCIYVDNKISSVGLNEIKFKDGTVISFIITKNIYYEEN